MNNVPSFFQSTNTTYRILKYIGKGSQSCCYKVSDINTDLIYAAKVYIIPVCTDLCRKYDRCGPIHISKDRHFDRESNIIRKFSHPNIVKYIEHFSIYPNSNDNDNDNSDDQGDNKNNDPGDVSDDDSSEESYEGISSNYYYRIIITEYCSKGSLKRILSRRPISQKLCVEYFRGLVNAVKYMHNRGYIHLDVKPGNILIDKHNQVKLTDFDLTRTVKENYKGACGTPNYVAPEIISGVGWGKYSDIWSCGATLYTISFGTPPFATDDSKETYKLIKTCKYYIPPNCNEHLVDILRGMLTLSTKDRLTPDDILNHEYLSSGEIRKDYLKIMVDNLKNPTKPQKDELPKIPEIILVKYKRKGNYFLYELNNGVKGIITSRKRFVANINGIYYSNFCSNIKNNEWQMLAKWENRNLSRVNEIKNIKNVKYSDNNDDNNDNNNDNIYIEDFIYSEKIIVLKFSNNEIWIMYSKNKIISIHGEGNMISRCYKDGRLVSLWTKNILEYGDENVSKDCVIDIGNFLDKIEKKNTIFR